MKKSIIAVLAVFLAAALFIGAGSAITIFPYTDVNAQDSTLTAGQTLYLITAPNTVIKLLPTGSGTGAYFTSDNLVAGTYSLDVGGTFGNYVVSNPDVTIKVSLFGKPTSNMNGQTVSSQSGLNFTITEIIAGYNSSKLEFTTPAGGKTSYLGAVDSDRAINPDSWSADNKTFFVENLYTSAVTAGTWKAQAKVTGAFLNKATLAPITDTYTSASSVSFTVGTTVDSITADKDKVIRGNSFLVTIVGIPGDKVNVTYDISEIDVHVGQSGVNENNDGFQITLGDSGKKVIQFDTDSNTDEKSYKITAKFALTGSEKSVKVAVEKGKITIVSDADSYYIGNEVTVSGTNTETKEVYLYVKGANKALQTLPTTDGYLESPIIVDSDNTWKKSFTFANEFDAGTYTIYAVADNYTVDNHIVQTLTPAQKDYQYATCAVTLKQPFLTATAASNTIAKGDKIEVTGQVEGTPDALLYYVFGTNFFTYNTIIPEDDGTYSKEIETGDLATGQYFVVIQHPMYDNLFNVQPGDRSGPYYIDNGSTVYNPFLTSGSMYDIYSFATLKDGTANKLVYRDYISNIKTRQTANAAQAVCDLIDEEYVDDIYVKLDFTVANAYVTINAVADQKQGATFTISGTTNVKVDESVTIDVISTKFQAEPKASVSAASYLVQTAKVVAGSNGVNTYSATFDGTPLAIDAYTAVATIARSTASEDLKVSTTFNIVSAPATPTATTTGTTAPTTPTATATQTPAKTPGFGALIALAGLGAVAVLVLRRQ